MATERARLDVEITGKDKVSPAANKAAKSVQNLSLQTRALHNVISGFFTRQVLNFGRDLLESYHTQERAMALVNVGALRATKTLGITTDELLAKASELQSKTIFGDELISEKVMAQLLSFPNIVGEQFIKTTETVLDIASLTGRDLQGITEAMAKALADPERGLGALRRFGVTISENQSEQIKNLAEQNDLVAAQSMLLDIVEGQYGDIAEYIALTDFGQFEQFKNTMGDLKEMLGEMLEQELSGVFAGISDVAKGLEGMDESMKRNITTIIILAGVGGTLFTVMSSLALAMKLLSLASLGVGGVLVGTLGVVSAAVVLLIDEVDLWGNESLNTIEKVEEAIVKAAINMEQWMWTGVTAVGLVITETHDKIAEFEEELTGRKIKRWTPELLEDYNYLTAPFDEGGSPTSTGQRRETADLSYSNLNKSRRAQREELENRRKDLEDKLAEIEGLAEDAVSIGETEKAKSRRTEKEAALFAVMANLLLTLIRRQEETNVILELIYGKPLPARQEGRSSLEDLGVPVL